MGKFQRVGWAPMLTPEMHDLGTDILVAARDHRRFDRGLLVGVQVKSGASWFREKQRNTNRSVTGWWYREQDTRHFDYWITHHLPHLLVLHDLDSDISYWVHVTSERTVRTGEGCKILVPATQTIDAGNREDLLRVAERQKTTRSFEGTVFTASPDAVPPGRRLRYALLAPRLVAPHRNSGYSVSPGPEEGAALVVQGRFADLREYANLHAGVFNPERNEIPPDWPWRFVRALWMWTTSDQVDGLREALDQAPDNSSRAAAAVALSCALLRREGHYDAESLLTEIIDSDLLHPVDQAWLQVQRSRTRFEVGRLRESREDAVEAQRSLIGDADDPTASALSAAAAWQLFATAALGEANIEELLTASDTSVSWWRSQAIAAALEESSSRAFREWAQDRAYRWSREDLESLNLFAAELNADLVGEHGTWRALGALAARHQLLRPGVEVDEVTEGLDTLRRCGDATSLQLAIRRIFGSGPISGVFAAASRIGSSSWTRTSAKATFEFWKAAGEIVEPGKATEAVFFCIDNVKDSGRRLRKRLYLTFRVDLAAAEAIPSLLSAARPEAHNAAATLLAEWNGSVPDVLSGPFAHLALSLRLDAISIQVRRRLLEFALAQDGQVAAEILGLFARQGEDRAKTVLVDRAHNGDLHALAAAGPITAFSIEAAEKLIIRFEEMVRVTLAEAERNEYTFNIFDGAQGLALFNTWFPTVARWEPLTTLLVNDRVAGEHKVQACKTLIALANKIPPEARDAISAAIPGIQRTQDQGFAGEGIGGLPVLLAITFGEIKGSEADAAAARLILGSADERQHLATLLRHGLCLRVRPLLAALAVDSDLGVRVTSAMAIGQLLPLEPNDPLLSTLAERIANDQGVAAPRALVRGLGNAGVPLSDSALRLTLGLANHPAASVRLAVESLKLDPS